MKPSVITTLRARSALALAVLLLSGCGAWQTVKDTSSTTARAIFIAKVKKMHLVIEGRTELNRDEDGVSLPVAIRVYQLKDAKTFQTATYAQLLNETGDALKADVLSRSEVLLGPNASAALDAPMADDAQVVGIVAFFRDPATTEWQLVIPKSQWKKTDPVKIRVIGNKMELEQ